jgi:hypothetical protein
MANDDPEGRLCFEKTARHAGDGSDMHLLTDLVCVKDLEVDAFQRGVQRNFADVHPRRFWLNSF